MSDIWGTVIIAVALSLCGHAILEQRPRHTHPTQEATMPDAPTRELGINDLFDALWQVESSRRERPPDGDDGRSIGPYQITKEYWFDAEMQHGVYGDCLRKSYAESVMLRYWERWCPGAREAGDWETLARVHNGGPRGAEKESTVAYWARVREVMYE